MHCRVATATNITENVRAEEATVGRLITIMKELGLKADVVCLSKKLRGFLAVFGKRDTFQQNSSTGFNKRSSFIVSVVDVF